MKTLPSMHRLKTFFKRNSRLIIFSLAIFATCTLDIPNPVYKDYVGNYSFTVTTALLPDTMEVFNRYTMPFAHGVDTFVSYGVNPSAESSIDTLQFSQLIKKDTLKLYFVKQYIGDLTVRAIRPNLKENTVAVPIVVVNPYRISGVKQVVVGTNTTLLIVHFRNKPFSGTIKKVKWNVNGIFSPEGAIATPIIIRGDSVSTKKVFALIYDTLGNFISTDTATITIAARQPILHFTQDSLDAPVGQEIAIPVAATDCDSIKWTVKRLGLQTTTTGSLKVTFTSIGRDTIIAMGKSKYGLLSTPDTLYIKTSVFNYALQIDTATFPATIRARVWSQWQAAVTRNGSPVTGANVVYEWEIMPASIYDSIRTSSDGSLLQMFFADSITPFNLSVRAKISSDSTYRYQQVVTTRAFKPSCAFTQNSYTTAINTNLSVTLQAQDANADGSIAGIYYFTSDAGTIVSTNNQKTWNVQFTSIGQKTITAIATDNDGFSDTATVTVTVIANKPYFSRSAVDTSIWVKDSFRFVATAQCSNAGDSIVSYLWDVNNDNTYERPTTSNKFDTVFATTGIRTVRVQCRDSRGDTAATPMVFTVTVQNGAPQLKTITCTPAIVNIGGQVVVRVTANDTNGTVKRLAIKVNSNTDSLFTLRPLKNIDTSFTLTFSAAGKYLVSAAVYDDDSVKSAYLATADSVIVNRGEPVVSAFTKPPAVFINDSLTYSITATDINGTVVKYKVLWSGSSGWDSSAVNSFSKKFSTAGNKPVSIVVIDNDGMVSDTLKDTVVVRLARPVCLNVTPDTAIWMNDSYGYQIHSYDTNGTQNRPVKYYVSWDGGTSFTAQSDSVFAYAFATAGVKTIKSFVKDDDSLSSDTLVDSVRVRLGKPVVTGIIPDSAVFINDNYTYTVNATDTNGTIGRYYISWDSGVTYTAQTNATFSKSYSTAGLKIIKAYVKDNDSIPSDTVRDSVRVRSCVPVIDSIKIDPAGNNLFVLDSIRYRVFVRDTNGYVKKIYYAWNNGTTADDSLIIVRNISTIDTFITHVYDTASSGNRTIKIWLRDDDGIVSTANKDTTITVRKGLPLAGGLTPDTVWCVDNNNFAMSWSDTNGTVADSFKVSWDGGSSWTKNATGIFSKIFDTTTAKTTNQTAKIMVKDGDGFWSAVKDEAVTVRLGRPRVWGATFGDSIQWKTASVGYDTMFYVYKAGNPFTIIGATDSNGAIASYQWDRGDDTTIDYTTMTPRLNEFFTPNTASLVSVRGQDDDSLWSIKTSFYYYPDAPPPTTTTTSDPVAGVRKISWKFKDVKDGTATRYKIIVHFEGNNGYNNPDENNITDLASGWKAGTLYETGTTGYEFGFTYTPTNGSGAYYYQVIAQDSRGSKSYSLIGSFGF